MIQLMILKNKEWILPNNNDQEDAGVQERKVADTVQEEAGVVDASEAPLLPQPSQTDDHSPQISPKIIGAYDFEAAQQSSKKNY